MRALADPQLIRALQPCRGGGRRGRGSIFNQGLGVSKAVAHPLHLLPVPHQVSSGPPPQKWGGVPSGMGL